MAGRYTLRTPLDRIVQQFGVGNPAWEILPRYNIWPGQLVPVIRQTDRKREMVKLRWGFIPPAATNDKYAPFNADAETVATKAVFHRAIRRQRCLVPADGFYEWKRDRRAKVKGELPWFSELRGNRPFAFAGVWSRRENNDATPESFAILTTGPNEQIALLNDQMPVILSPDSYELWLDPTMQDPEKLTHLYKPFPASEMETYRVPMWVNARDIEGPRCVERIRAQQ
jgi:putative SOS response-associated peptidase YedK